ncbi:hypothetical protein ZYGM_003197 [Zygosaccharomyces mellis]|uniref:Uncharacterized protein n=1 Tax=Zygosaccharomyces mellis TaxID=42258 RepID=A0A4C2E8H7_9SACH|nr:hypothetical protein ZYGM_003197 [Zygosaccharomyces mellis]
MNSPTLRPEQLSPKLSPVAFSLDDPNNTSTSANNFQHILASPTKLSLDGNANGNNGSGAGNSLIYRTSLSKLSELSRRGRSRQRSNSDTLRSASPTRLQFFNNAPKMLKPEYVSYQPSGMPLLSALIGNGSTGPHGGRLGIKETLEMFHRGFSSKSRPSQKQEEQRRQRQAQESQLRPEQKGEGSDRQLSDTTLNEEKYKQFRGGVSNKYDNNNDDANNNDNSNNNNNNNDNHANEEHNDESENLTRNQGSIPGTETNMTAPIDEDGTLKKKSSSPRENQGTRMASNSSVASSTMTVNFNDMSKEVELDMLPTDKNGFVELVDGKSNRCSFISSSSTDFDADWYNHQHFHINEETAKLDYRIKQLELELDELKIQNQKLIRSITTNRTAEDEFMLDALKEIRYSKQKAQRGMERRVKQLEGKVESYRKVLGFIGDGPSQSQVHSQLPYGQISACSESPKKQNYKKRIARISSMELRKIEEHSDSSSPTSPSASSSDDSEYEETEKTFEEQPSMEEATMIQDGNTVSSNSIRRIGGFHLNIPLEMQRNNNDNQRMTRAFLPS